MKRRKILVNELYHYGIQGQQWGLRRYQNPDGSLTPEGKERFHARYVESEGLQRNRNHIQGLSDTLHSLSGDKTQKERAKALRAQLRTERTKLRENRKIEQEAFKQQREYEQGALKDIHSYYQTNKRFANSLDRLMGGIGTTWRFSRLSSADQKARMAKLQGDKSSVEGRNTELLNKSMDEVLNRGYVDTIRSRISRLKKRRKTY